MKTFLEKTGLFLILCVISLSVDAKPKPTPIPKPTPSVETQPSREEIMQTVEHMQRLAKDAVLRADAALAENATLKGNLSTIQSEKAEAVKSIGVLQGTINDLRAVNQMLQKQVDTDKLTIAHLLKLLHRWKFWAGGALVILVGIAVFKLMPVWTGPYRLWATLGAMAAVSGYIVIFT